MKIAIYSSYFDPVGGVEEYLKNITSFFLGKNLELMIVSENKTNSSFIISELLRKNFHELSAISHGSLLEKILKWQPNLLFINTFSKYDLVHDLVNKLPSVVFCHGILGTCLSGTKVWEIPSHNNCKESLGIKCFPRYWFNRCGGKNPFKAFALFKNAIKQRRILDKCSRVMVASNWMADVFSDNSLSPQKIIVNPLFPSNNNVINAPEERQYSYKVLLSGRITKYKGWRDAVLAVSLASGMIRKELELIIAGSGPESNLVEDFARKVKLKVRLLGQLDQISLDFFRKTCDILLMPSLAAEGFGLAGLESGLFGCPTIGYNVGGINEWLTEGINGCLIDIGKNRIEALSRSISKVYQDIDFWKNLRDGALKTSKRFTLQSHGQKLINIFNEVSFF